MSIEITLADRQKTHGDFTNHARVSQGLKQALVFGQQYNKLTNAEQEALEMILHKVARIVCGNPHHKDHWHDIQGYAALVEARIQE